MHAPRGDTSRNSEKQSSALTALEALCLSQATRSLSPASIVALTLPASLSHRAGFGAPIWRNTILLLVAGFGVYRFSNLHSEPHSSRASSSGRSAPGNESEDSHEAPFITRYLAQFITPPSVYKERNERHLDLVRQAAEDKLFFQDAERPPVHRLRYTA